MATAPRTQVAARGLLHPAFGPLVRVELTSPAGQRRSGLAILDTGASSSTVDPAVARALMLPSPGAASWVSVSDNGKRALSPLRTAAVRVGESTWSIELNLIEAPGLSARIAGYEILALLGWDYLNHAKLTCDGPEGTFTLEVPDLGRQRRKR